MKKTTDFLFVILVFLISVPLFAQNDFVISYDMTEAQIDDEIKSYILSELGKAGIQKDEESYSEIKSILDKIELKIDKIKNEQSSVFDAYANPDDKEIMKALKLFVTFIMRNGR